MTKVIDIDQTTPSVESVITRLFYGMDQITGITCVIDWVDGTTDWCGSEKDPKDMIYHTAILQRVCSDLLEAYSGWDEDDE